MQNNIEISKSMPVLGIVISLIIILLFAAEGIKPLDNIIYDYFMTLRLSEEANKEIVIIKIDSESIRNIDTKRWPWSRSIHAKLTKMLLEAKPKVIGLNILFSEPTNNDNSFIKVLNKAKNIVTAFANEEGLLIFPIQGISHNSIVADITVVKDKDGIVRSAYSNSSMKNKHYKTFARTISELYRPGISKNLPDNRFLVNYINLTNKFTSYSVLELFTNRNLLEDLKDKIVLVGVTAEGSASKFNIPLSNKLEFSISGVELQAHIINTIITNKYIKQVHIAVLFILLLIFSLLLDTLLKVKKADQQAMIVTAFLILPIIISYIMFSYYMLWLPPSAFLIAAVVIYLIYSSRTLLKIDKSVENAINKLSEEGYIPMPEIANRIEKGVISLAELSQIINKDRQMIRAILDAINSPVLVFDQNGTIIWKNNQASRIEKLNTITSSSELGVNFDEMIIQIMAKERFSQEIDIEDREYLAVSTSAGEKNPLYVTVFNDITDLKSLDRLKTELVRTVSHEIRTPLTVIQSYCDLGAEMKDGTLALEYLNKISNKTEELTLFLTDFMDLNKLEANMVQLSLVDVNISDLLKEVYEENIVVAQAKNIELNLDIDVNTTIIADKSRLKQVFNNLLSNAIKYSPPQTIVIIRAIEENEQVKISIIDEGYGIAEDQQPKVFDKFYRVHTEQTQSITGTGLGLSIVSKIIQMHKARIYLISKPASGTTFTVILDKKI